MSVKKNNTDYNLQLTFYINLQHAKITNSNLNL